jgi:hypothetical protein
MGAVCIKCKSNDRRASAPPPNDGRCFAAPRLSQHARDGIEESKKRLFEQSGAHVFWSIENHFDFPKKFRAVIRFVLLCVQAKRENNLFSLLSKDLVQNKLLPLLGEVYYVKS